MLCLVTVIFFVIPICSLVVWLHVYIPGPRHSWHQIHVCRIKEVIFHRCFLLTQLPKYSVYKDLKSTDLGSKSLPLSKYLIFLIIIFLTTQSMRFHAVGEMARLKSPPWPRAGIQACLELLDELVRQSRWRFICMELGLLWGCKNVPKRKRN